MKKSHSLTLTGPGTSDFIRRDTIKLDKGQGASALRAVVTLGIKNTSGAAKTPTEKDKQAIADSFLIDLKYGHDGARHPYRLLSGYWLHLLWRYLTGVKFALWEDTISGLAKSCANAVTTMVTFHLMIPTGRLWQIPGLVEQLAMGRTQARTVELEARWNPGARAFETAGLSVDAEQDITLQVYPDVVKQKTDTFSWLPEFAKTDVRDFKFDFPDALPLLALETTNAQSATPISRLNVKVDGQQVQADVAPQIAYQQTINTPNFPTAGDISDLATVFYALKPHMRFRDLLSGRLYVEQPGQELASMSLAFLSMPVVPQSEIDATIEDLAALRGKGLKAVGTFPILEPGFPSHLAAFSPFALFDRQDAEYQKYPGIGVEPGGKPEVYIPASGLEVARSGVAARKAHGEHLAVKDQIYNLARYIPGAAANGRGFGGGSLRLAELARLVGAA